MFPDIFAAQGIVTTMLGLAAFGLQAFALVDALRQRTDAFPAAGKRTKQIWLIVTGVAAAIGFISIFSPLNIFNLAAVVGAAVYLVDVRPAVRAVTGRGGTSNGPYGGW